MGAGVDLLDVGVAAHVGCSPLSAKFLPLMGIRPKSCSGFHMLWEQSPVIMA